MTRQKTGVGRGNSGESQDRGPWIRAGGLRQELNMGSGTNTAWKQTLKVKLLFSAFFSCSLFSQVAIPAWNRNNLKYF